MSAPTYDEINRAFSSLDVSKHSAALAHVAPATVTSNPASVLGSVCPIYQAVRPFLEAAADLPVIPAVWRTGIKAFIGAMDLLCPAAKKSS